MSAPRYPGALFIQSPETAGRARRDTLGIVIHWTAGYEPGDVRVLSQQDPRSVNVQFYVPRDGDPAVYQFTETDERANHAYATANAYMVGIECEGFGGPWTDVQFTNVAKLTAWLCDLYAIPKIKCDPSGWDLSTFRGVCGHRDLSVGGLRVDGNDHTDTVPDDPGWERFMARVRGESERDMYYFESLPYNEGGVGPSVLGPRAGFSRAATRDDYLERIQAAHPDLLITRMRGDDGLFYILGWGDLRGRDWYRSAGYATPEARDRELGKRARAWGIPLRAYRGKNRSIYPWPD